MWIVRLALRQPYTFAVMALLILLLGALSIVRMPTDIFPVFNIPVVTVLWQYNGITPNDMATRFVAQSERAFTTTVANIEHTESQSVSGVGVIKIYFQPNADISTAIAQVTASAQTSLRILPPGTQPPLILRYDASDVPILQASVTSPTESQATLFDDAQQFIRTQLATVQGAQLPLPYGGANRTINVDLDMQALTAHGLTPFDVSNAISAQNLILPTGDAKIGTRDYLVQTNASPTVIAKLNNIPIKDVNGAVITVGDVAYVRDGSAIQNNIVNEDGRRSVLLTVLKSGDALTIDVVNRVRAALPGIEATLPEDIKVNLLSDQSIFVRASVQGVIREAALAAFLTAAMILLFLGSIRSTLIVAVSIPLSILSSIIILGMIGQTLNIMTLGGLALAVGILVDDTTVTIENINRNLGRGLALRQAILEGAREIAGPAFISTLSICIVFAPVAFLSGAARSLFMPLALAVVFAMMASYLLSRTVTPTFAAYLLRKEVLLYREDELAIEDDPHSPDYERIHAEHEKELHKQQAVASSGNVAANQSNGKSTNANGAGTSDDHHDGSADEGHGHLYERHKVAKRKFDEDEKDQREASEKIKRGIVWRIHEKFNKRFARMRGRYVENLRWVLEHKLPVAIVFAVFCALSFILVGFVGRDFFPSVDAGQFRLHVRLASGTRVEETASQFATVESEIRRVVGNDQISLVLDNIGEPIFLNLAYSDSATVGPSDGEILVSLKENHTPVAKLQRELRADLPKKFPGDTFFFQPGDIVSQILNFGLPEPIDIQVAGPGRNMAKDYQVAQEVLGKVSAIPGAADVHLQQISDYPALNVNIDRSQAAQLNLTQANASDNLLISLAGSGQAAPTYYVDQHTAVVYTVSIQTPQFRVNSLDSILNTPIGYSPTGTPELLGNVAQIVHGTAPAVINHYNIQPVYDIYASNQDRDLGGVASDINKVLDSVHKDVPRGSTITVRGQVMNMNQSFSGLGFGLIGAIILVYLLLTINFQSWFDPLVVVSGAPGALSGILWMLFATQTSLSVPSLMGAIMSIGVSTANSVLLVTFANERRLEGMSAVDAVVAAGYTRLRPILMTALAMVIGMIPMALGLGEGGEQNAPLGRAVIGGLVVATFTTLFIVPIFYSVLRKHEPEPVDNSDLDELPRFSDQQNGDQNRNGAADGQAPRGNKGATLTPA